MKARVTKPDGTVVEIEGTPEEIARAIERPARRLRVLATTDPRVRIGIDKPS